MTTTVPVPRRRGGAPARVGAVRATMRDPSPQGRSVLVATHSATASVGQPAPDFSLDDADGRTVRLADELAHGPVVVVFLRGFA